VLARAAAWLDRAAFSPAKLPDDLIIGIALAPPIAAGLIIFKLPAAEMLGVAVAAGVGAELVARIAWRKSIPRPQASPLIAALFGVALIGPAAPLTTRLGELEIPGVPILIAVLAVTLELLRARYIPAVRAQAGLMAYAAIWFLSRAAPRAYVDPSASNPLDPIAYWFNYFRSEDSMPVDAIRLYVGNVPGPVFATSMLAVIIGLAWLAYSRRLSLAALGAFLVGALIPIQLYHWNPLFHLDSGPTWFVAGLLLADRKLLPGPWAIRPLLGFVAGLLTMQLRASGSGIEGSFLAVAAVEAVVAVIVAVLWGFSLMNERMQRTRRLRQREAQLRVVNDPVSRAG
jgi:Na+-transporting NADH:ubiquinone oxidoreductase subunit NqrB